jgi:hypothetical protein
VNISEKTAKNKPKKTCNKPPVKQADNRHYQGLSSLKDIVSGGVGENVIYL